jgi:hypothetical protein
MGSRVAGESSGQMAATKQWKMAGVRHRLPRRISYNFFKTQIKALLSNGKDVDVA